MNDFLIHWLDGKKEPVAGTDIADAANKAGIGNGAIRAIDYYDNGIKIERQFTTTLTSEQLKVMGHEIHELNCGGIFVVCTKSAIPDIRQQLINAHVIPAKSN